MLSFTFSFSIRNKYAHQCRKSYAKLFSSNTETSVSTIYPNFSFTIRKCDQIGGTKARTGVIQTPHGIINTPNFVFCATKAAMKAITPTHLRDEGSEIILSNTYHLMLTPGSEIGLEIIHNSIIIHNINTRAIVYSGAFYRSRVL